MRRWQLFEFGDQRWLPSTWRTDLIEYLQHQIVDAGLYAPAVPKLLDALERSGERRIVDLGSGPGLTISAMSRWLSAAGWDGTVVGSDLFPPRRPRHWPYHPDPVDASDVPACLPGFRTLFTTFHHFSPRQATAVLAAAVADKAPLAVFEFTRRHPANLLGMLLSPLDMWRTVHRAEPHSGRRLFWTYILPVLPILYWWDGTVSHLRTYGPSELAMLVGNLGDTAYEWEIGTLPGRPYTLTYLIGVPRPSASTSPTTSSDS